MSRAALFHQAGAKRASAFRMSASHPKRAASTIRQLDSADGAWAESCWMSKSIRLLLVDNEPLVRRGLRMRLGSEPDFDVVGEAGSGEEAISLATELEPDIVLLDVQMPGIGGLLAAKALCAARTSSRIVMLSLHDDVSTRREAHKAGAHAFVGKQEGSERLVRVIRGVALDREIESQVC